MGKKDEILKKINEIGISKLVLMVFAGIVLIVLSLPSGKNSKENAVVLTDEVQQSQKQDDKYVADMEKKLKQALTKVDGIGNTEVMITLKASKEVIINKDTPIDQENVTEEDSGGGKRESNKNSQKEETILVTDSNGNNVPYIVKELEPEVAGVVVVAEGGDNQQIIMEITEAVEVLFSVPVHKIKVMKMK